MKLGYVVCELPFCRPSPYVDLHLTTPFFAAGLPVSQLAAGAELAGVLQAERLATVGISSAHALDSLAASPCR